MSHPAGDATTRLILQKRYSSVGCYVCQSRSHTHLTCPHRPCKICNQGGHLCTTCPYRLRPGGVVKVKSGDRRWRFLRQRELDAADWAVHPARLNLRNRQLDCTAVLGVRRVHEKRITAAEWHPDGRFVVTGDKGGG